MKCNKNRAMKELIWRTANEFALTNLKILLLTLHEDFGFGKDRLFKLVVCLKEKVKRYDEADNDGVLDYVLNRDIEGLGLDESLSDFLTSSVGNSAAHRKSVPRENTSISEAEEIRAKMVEIKKYMEDEKNENQRNCKKGKNNK